MRLANFNVNGIKGRLPVLLRWFGGRTLYTSWDYFRNAWGRNAGLRIDHLLLSPMVAKRFVAAGVDREVRGWEKGSDHAPVGIELGEQQVARHGPRR